MARNSTSVEPGRAARRTLARALLLIAAGVRTLPAQAADEPAPLLATVPSSHDQGTLALELAADGLWARVCAESSCAARSGRKLDVPSAALGSAGRGKFDVLELAPGRRLAHVRIPLADGQWEALVAATPGAPEPRVIYAGMTGPLTGEEGEREGDAVWVRAGDNKGVRVLVGRQREDVQLCGRPTLLEARLLGADLSLRPAKVQQLSVDERRAARVLEAARTSDGPTPGANALRAVAASSALGSPQFLTDGRAETSWAEARGGDGRGEFVVLRLVSSGSLVSLELLARPEGEAPATGAAPSAFWLLTRTSAFRIDWSEDAWKAPGVWYRVQLPEPVQDDCLALVLEQSHATHAETQVTLAELRGVTELQSVGIAELVGRLSTPGEAGAEAVPALRQAGAAGAEAVVGAFGALDALGRARALEVIEDAPCELTAHVFALLVQSDEEGVRRRAERRLRACGQSAWPALRAAFEATSAAAGTGLADALARVTPALAVELIGPRLAKAPPEPRAAYRDALGRAARDPSSEPALRRLLVAGEHGLATDVEVLRALAERLPSLQPEASRCFVRALSSASEFERRFLLLGPADRLRPPSRVRSRSCWGRWVIRTPICGQRQHVPRRRCPNSCRH